MQYKLIMGNQAYSSWSLRGWLLLRAFGIEFEPEVVPLYVPEWQAYVDTIYPANTVPALQAGSGADQITIWDSLAIAEFLGLPSVTVARKISIINGEKARVERVTSDGYEIVEVVLPALITVSNEIGEARYPAIQNIRIANKIDPTLWKPADIGLEPTQVGERGRRQKLIKLFQPVREETCEMIEGETPEEAAENLALTLRKAKIM